MTADAQHDSGHGDLLCSEARYRTLHLHVRIQVPHIAVSLVVSCVDASVFKRQWRTKFLRARRRARGARMGPSFRYDRCCSDPDAVFYLVLPRSPIVDGGAGRARAVTLRVKQLFGDVAHRPGGEYPATAAIALLPCTTLDALHRSLCRIASGAPWKTL